MIRLFSSMLTLTICALASCAGTKASAATDSPNVIVIFVDDQGYYDLGCYGD